MTWNGNKAVFKPRSEARSPKKEESSCFGTLLYNFLIWYTSWFGTLLDLCWHRSLKDLMLWNLCNVAMVCQCMSQIWTKIIAFFVVNHSPSCQQHFAGFQLLRQKYHEILFLVARTKTWQLVREAATVNTDATLVYLKLAVSSLYPKYIEVGLGFSKYCWEP